MTDPTRTTYQGLTEAYDFFNERLFAGRLPRCLITMQRQKEGLRLFRRRALRHQGRREDHRRNHLNPAIQEPHDRGKPFDLRPLNVPLEQEHFGKPGPQRLSQQGMGRG